MSNMNKRNREQIYPLIMARQGGEFCVMCLRNKNSLIAEGFKPEFCIDVIDNSNNHSITNIAKMQFLCHSCNTTKNHPSLEPSSEKSMSPEMLANKTNEPTFRRYISGKFQINPNLALPYYDLVASGAEFTSCSIQSIKNYLTKMTCSEGMYEWENRSGGSFLTLKEKYR